MEGWAPTLSCSRCPYSFLHLLCPNPPIHILTVLLTPPIPPSRSDLHFSAMQSKKFSPSSLFHISSLLAPRAKKATSSSHSARRSFHSLCFFHRVYPLLFWEHLHTGHFMCSTVRQQSRLLSFMHNISTNSFWVSKASSSSSQDFHHTQWRAYFADVVVLKCLKSLLIKQANYFLVVCTLSFVLALIQIRADWDCCFCHWHKSTQVLLCHSTCLYYTYIYFFILSWRSLQSRSYPAQ